MSIHFPERDNEVRRVVRQVRELAGRGIRSGINFVVARSNLAAARQAAAMVRGTASAATASSICRLAARTPVRAAAMPPAAP